jgi:16S rRNA (cytidine1402-2'-O)-methyltransferase
MGGVEQLIKHFAATHTYSMLYIVATPIGNLGDITLRAVETLTSADFIIAENPAHTGKLLHHLHIPKKEMMQFADHNEMRALPKLIERLKTQNGALVSDAGTPGISDPGFRLVRACIEQNISVVPIPGASAAVAALSASGLPTDKFLFVGFLPKTEPKLLRILEEAKTTESTLVAYESPQRIQKTVSTIARTIPEAHIVVGRELTKMHEEFIRGNANTVSQELNTKQTIKGEIVLLISFK